MEESKINFSEQILDMVHMQYLAVKIHLILKMISLCMRYIIYGNPVRCLIPFY